MEKYKKFLGKLPAPLRIRLIKTLYRIADGDFKGLDIKKLHKDFPVYGCRVDKVRVVFEKSEDGNRIVDAGFRGGVY